MMTINVDQVHRTYSPSFNRRPSMEQARFHPKYQQRKVRPKLKLINICMCESEVFLIAFDWCLMLWMWIHRYRNVVPMQLFAFAYFRFFVTSVGSRYVSFVPYFYHLMAGRGLFYSVSLRSYLLVVADLFLLRSS